METIKTPQAAQKRNVFNLSNRVLRTCNTGYLAVPRIDELVPNDKFTYDVSMMTRLLPMHAPALANMTQKLFAFFVPFRLIHGQWEAFKTSQKFHTSSSQLSYASIPTITMTRLFEAFHNTAGNSTQLPQSPMPEVFDYKVTIADVTRYYRYTAEGKKVVDLMKSLGYAVNFGDEARKDTQALSLLPILAYQRIYLDYFKYPQSAADKNDKIYFWCEQGTNSWVGNLNDDDIMYLFEPRHMQFDQDYFYSSWQNPNGNSNTVQGGYSAQSLVGSQYFAVSESDVPTGTKNPFFVLEDDEDSPYINKTTLDALYAVTRDLKIRNVVGLRYINQILAFFGARPSNARLQRPEFLGSTQLKIQIDDIFATSAGTDGESSTVLGDYAGRSLNFGGGKFEYQAEEDGLLLFLNSITYKQGWYQGRRPHVMHYRMLDFYNPLYDSVGTHPITKQEIVSGVFGKTIDDIPSVGREIPSSGYLQQVFGYAPQYADLKVKQDDIQGDFDISSLNSDLKSFYNYSDFRSMFVHGSGIAWSDTFATSNPITWHNRSNQIFDYNGLGQDHFINSFVFECKAVRPMLSLGQSYFSEQEHADGITHEIPNGGYVLS